MSDTAAAAASDAEGSAASRSEHAPRRGEEKRGFFARIALFVRQVVAELKKVVRPTRHELVTYTGVVLVFVTVVMLFVTLIDLGIGKLTFLIFG
ncbi:preprotein translocase subunit SecE [Cellulomonas sp. zg-ZUI222]|uniref:Protein translocase subunit SecE n=1 Tax=Cellulomonas wangleii TaxID=2816956 RepID=A0ABX8D612_9CELL|nr:MULTISPECIES: preprotein translocase subunit SecE [Cellulomonas]MBO0899615.1 preprotein translocase subunit SecE [Cellulomonas sp. zg-ZUI22]MBO0920477.1 preprotein translocase subunit SecE [Cellulomonas wangleii]MBO0923105.1 preprotein translocase subunit SecE [Cellulomonas wangleii]QVI61487.1 preprotein translocase subunit SecE [Cellulomonas wangleii]